MRKWHSGKWGASAVIITIGVFVISLLVIVIVRQIPVGSLSYSSISATDNNVATVLKSASPPITHIRTPDPLRAIYITACTASDKRSREKVLSVMMGTEINALAIDIKDYSGTLAYASTSVSAQANNGGGCRIYDLQRFIQELHEKGIYTIARITVFQDPVYANQNPLMAVKNRDNTNAVWKDIKGLSYIDPGAPSYWDYIIKIGREAYKIGFDELNFDYIRFPSDGNLSNAYYPWSAGKPKDEVIRSFFLYLREGFASTSIPLSADLFGLTTSAEGDLGIGQRLEDALVYFDYVSPMVYPSHFAHNFNGYPKPALKPYEVVKYSMDRAVQKAINASSTPSKLRPWLQAFDLGAVYSPAMVRAQIQATYDAGLNSYMLWNAGSVYNKEELSVIPDEAEI